MALARRAAQWMTETALASTDQLRFALSGGATPKALYRVLASPDFARRFPWSRVSWFWSDERFVAHDDPRSNFGMAHEALLSRVRVPAGNVFAIPFRGLPEEAARRYEGTLQKIYGAPVLDPSRPLFDIVLLGMGSDGHTASLLPGSAALRERKRWVVAVTHGRPEARITLTCPAIDSSRAVAFLVQGAQKATMFQAVIGGRSGGVPAALVQPVGEVIWFVDRAAAGHDRRPSTQARSR